MNEVQVAHAGQSGTVPLVFISHKHVDRQIAKVLADFISEESRGEVDVHNSSNSDYLGPTTGERLTDALRSVLWRTDVLLLVYTAADQDWSFCMWEAGVATDSQSPDTRTVVLQCGDEEPPPFQGFVRVDLRSRDDVRKFVSDFFLDSGYFPRRKRGLTPRWKKESVLRVADELHAALATVIQPIPTHFANLWPTILLTVQSPVSDAVRSNAVDRAACRSAVSEGATVSSWFEFAAHLFGVDDIKGLSLTDLKDRWCQVTGIADTAWHVSCCDQIVDIMLGVAPVVREEELQKPDSDATLTPAVTRWRKSDDMEFELQFIDLSNPRGIAVEDRMLAAERIRFKEQEKTAGVLLVDLTEEMDARRINRLPILDQDKRVTFVVHKSIIDRYLISRRREMNSVSLDDLLRAEEYVPTITAMAFVPLTATMAEARKAMLEKPNCRDVFVTAHGDAADPIVGWLTNADFRRSRT